MTKRPTTRPVQVGMISLGCAKNLVDAEVMLGALLRDGMQLCNDARRADVVIINTCSFIDSAQEESVDAILQSDALRADAQRHQALIVSGCLSQRYHDQLPRLLPEVDAFMGIDQVAEVPRIVRQALARRAAKLQESDVGSLDPAGPRSRPFPPTASSRTPAPVPGRAPKPANETESAGTNRLSPGPAPVDVTRRPVYVPDYATPRFRLTPRHHAYLKIAEGCNHPCSFCIIPRMRGSHRSRSQADIVAEARQLIASGVRELNLISQDSTYYGLDLRPNHNRAISSPDKFGSAVAALPSGGATICTLLRELNALPGEFWIRLLYTHPAHWTDELIQTIAECRKVARYVDIPLQHIHDNMLERMRRETSREYIEKLLARIRAGIPGIALRTTFIVGFPGETEASFQSLLKFIRTAKFERLGVFTYSREAGTRAGAMAGQISGRVKQKRRILAMAAQRRVSREIARSSVGRTLKVLVEGRATPAQLHDAGFPPPVHRPPRTAISQSPISNLKSQIHSVARGEADAADIDGRVYVRGRLPAGEFARVRVVGHADYDLLAVPV